MESWILVVKDWSILSWFLLLEYNSSEGPTESLEVFTETPPSWWPWTPSFVPSYP